MNLTLASTSFAPYAAPAISDSAAAFATIVDQGFPTKGSVGDIARANVVYAETGETSEPAGDAFQVFKGDPGADGGISAGATQVLEPEEDPMGPPRAFSEVIGDLAVDPNATAGAFPSDDGSGNVGPRAISQDIRSENPIGELYRSDAAPSLATMVAANTLHGLLVSKAADVIASLGNAPWTLVANRDNAAASAFSGIDATKAKPYSPEFRTQSAAADYISSQMISSSSYAPADEKMRDAVNEACREWKPGMDLGKMVYDKVRSALTGVLPEFPSQSGSSAQPDALGTPDSIARIAEAQIQANGNTVGGVAEHMLFTPSEQV